MRQAGRYLPEYRAVRSKVSFETMCRTPELCAEVTLQPIDRYGFDAAILFSDILVVFDAIGVPVAFNPAPQVATPVRTAAELEALRWGRAVDHLGYVFDAVRACKQALADRVPLIGFCGAPMTTASYMIEGGGSREFEHTKAMAFCEPALFGRMLERITTLLIEYLGQQVAAGADALQIFESWGAAFAPQDYRLHVLPHLQRLLREVAPLGVPVILFVRGNASLLRQTKDLGADVIGIDWSIELDEAIATVGRERVVQGNMDPLTLLGPPELIEQTAKRIVEQGRAARAHIFNLGHGISRHTDPAMVQHLVDAVRSA